MNRSTPCRFGYWSARSRRDTDREMSVAHASRIPGAAVILVSLVALGGCKKISEKIAEKVVEKTIEESTGGKVDIDTKGQGGVTFKDDKGNTLTTGAAAELPDAWPNDVPKPPGAKVVASIMSDVKGKQAMQVTFESSAAPAEVADLYKSKLAKMTKKSEMDINGQKMVFFESSERGIMVSAGRGSGKASGDKTIVTVSITPKST